MPISSDLEVSFNLEDLRVKHNCVNYFETGLWESKLSLSCGFNKVYCFEPSNDWVKMGHHNYKKHIMTGKYNLYLNTSVNIRKYLMTNDFKNKTMFFLDACVDDNCKKGLPLFDELEAIKSIERKDNVILIDYLSFTKNTYPWNKTSYGSTNLLQQIINTILTINKHYKFDTLNGYRLNELIQDDILLAYI